MVDQEEIHRMAQSEDAEERRKAVIELDNNIEYLSDKKQLWTDLLKLFLDNNSNVWQRAAVAIVSVFPHVTDKEQAWDDLHRLTNDNDKGVRMRATDALRLTFPHISNKEQAWTDLRRLVQDNNSRVQRRAAVALGSVFSHVTDKEQAWDDLHQLTYDNDENVRARAATALGLAFPHIPNKEQAWTDLRRLVQDNICRRHAINALGLAFAHVPDKEQAWIDLHQFVYGQSNRMRGYIAYTLGLAFPYIPDKEQAKADLINLSHDKNRGVRQKAIKALGSISFQIPNEEHAWIDIVKLIQDVDRKKQIDIEESFESTSPQDSEKWQAWTELHKLTRNNNSELRRSAIDTIISDFPHIPDKQKAWADLIRLTHDTDRNVRICAAHSLDSAFPYVPDKEKAGEDIQKLTKEEESYLRRGAAYAMGSVFSYVSDKEKAWTYLHQLTQDKFGDVRRGSAYALGSAFSYIPTKEKAWADLMRLAQDEFPDVRVYANHSLGRASIFKAAEATESKEIFKKELEKAIDFFEKASDETTYYNPANFCLPFYRSFYAITFEKHDSEAEIQKYLAEAKSAVEGSESKEKLIEAIENLANALKEAQKAQEIDFNAMKSDLNSYRRYCERASGILAITEENAPSATKLIRKGLPIIDETIKEIISEIQNKAKALCKKTKDLGTPFEPLSVEVNLWARELSDKDYLKSERCINRITHVLGEFCKLLPKDKKGHACDILKTITEEEYLGDKLSKVELALTYLQPNIEVELKSSPKPVINDSIDERTQRTLPTIGIITALPIEYVAMEILLENRRCCIMPGQGAGRRYCLGEIQTANGNKHTLVLSLADMGNNIAATRASLLLAHFPSVKSILMVGIAGGIPHPQKPDDHVRLGDIVVSNRRGVIQYDFIKQEIKENEYRPPPRPPSASLLEAVRYIEADEFKGNRPLLKYIDQSLSLLKVTRPEDKTDILVSSTNMRKIIPHPVDIKRIKGQPRVFNSPIASANTLLKNPIKRDELRDKFGVKAVEMEGSGIADATWNHEIGYLVVRGICDYCDSNKTDDWQMYSAIIAAAYTRALIESMPNP